MKNYELKIIVETSDNFDEEEFTLTNYMVVDGFLITRSAKDIENNFKLKSAYIKEIKQLN